MYGSKGEEGVIDMAVNQLFYAMEETPNRKFLVMVSQTLTQGQLTPFNAGVLH